MKYPKPKYKEGDRVLLNVVKLREVHGNNAWESMYSVGTISRGPARQHAYGGEHPESTGWSYGVHWDGYDYRLDRNPDNCHSADEILFLPDEPDEDELNEVLASIGQAARNTTST